MRRVSLLCVLTAILACIILIPLVSAFGAEPRRAPTPPRSVSLFVCTSDADLREFLLQSVAQRYHSHFFALHETRGTIRARCTDRTLMIKKMEPRDAVPPLGFGQRGYRIYEITLLSPQGAPPGRPLFTYREEWSI